MATKQRLLHYWFVWDYLGKTGWKGVYTCVWFNNFTQTTDLPNVFVQNPGNTAPAAITDFPLCVVLSTWKFRIVTLKTIPHISWWRHQMEVFSASLVICAGNLPIIGEFPSQRPVTRSFDASLICAWINERVNNRETGDLRRHHAHYDVTVMLLRNCVLLATDFVDQYAVCIY